MIRKMEEKDISDVLQIWLETNIKAHSFIDKEYWTGNYEMVKQILPEAEVYVYEDEKNGQIAGFIGINDQYVEGLFVKETVQSNGIGKRLLRSRKERENRTAFRRISKECACGAFLSERKFSDPGGRN